MGIARSFIYYIQQFFNWIYNNIFEDKGNEIFILQSFQICSDIFLHSWKNDSSKFECPQVNLLSLHL